MKISDVKKEVLEESLNDPNMQELVAQFLGLLKLFDKTDKEEYLESLVDISLDLVDRLPYNEVSLDEVWTDSPTSVAMITGYLMIQQGILPPFD